MQIGERRPQKTRFGARRCPKSEVFGGKRTFITKMITSTPQDLIDYSNSGKVTSGGDHHFSCDVHRSSRPRLISPNVMRLLQHIASMLFLIGLLCHPAQAAGQPDPLADEIARGAAAKWRDVLARMDSEGETLAACRASPDSCSPPARRLLKIVELGRQRAGRARLGEIKRRPTNHQPFRLDAYSPLAAIRPIAACRSAASGQPHGSRGKVTGLHTDRRRRWGIRS